MKPTSGGFYSLKSLFGKRHVPNYEADHVLNIAYNILCNGDCLEDIECLQNDEVYLDALGAQRIPDPTTAGDFCRRFRREDAETLMDIINAIRSKVWKKQPADFFTEAIIDADGTIVGTTDECKEGMDMSYKGLWGYHPLLISQANTSEPLYLVNRSDNGTSSDQAAMYLNRAIEFCLTTGFMAVLLRGDTDFSQTGRLDGWDKKGIRFIFGLNAIPNLVTRAEILPKELWKTLLRPAKNTIKMQPKRRPANVKERIVIERQYENICFCSENLAVAVVCIQ